MEWPLGTLGFLEVSRGNYADAASALQPPVREFEANPDTDIASAFFLPDAIEALVSLGRHTGSRAADRSVGSQRPPKRPCLDTCRRRAVPQHVTGHPR